MSIWRSGFVRDEQGQDRIEYALLLAFMVLASAALFTGAGSSVQGIWSQNNRMLAGANRVATGKSPFN